MYINDKIYLYSPTDREYVGRVVELRYWAKGLKSRSRVSVKVVKPRTSKEIHHAGQIIDIEDGLIEFTGWNWSRTPIPNIRKNAVVVINNWSCEVECKVLGLSRGIRPGQDDFVYEGIRVLKNPRGVSLGRMKGHRFTAGTDAVKKVISIGTGHRLMTGDYLSRDEERELFKETDIYLDQKPR